MPENNGILLAGLSLLLLGCGPTGGVDLGPGPELGTLEQGLQCKAQWKSQYDNTGTACGTPRHSSICGPTSAAMMRYSMTCGQCDPSPGDVRQWYDEVNGTQDCCSLPGDASPCSEIGARPNLLYETMAHDHNDGCPVHTVANKCANNYRIADLVRDLSPSGGYVAVVSGDMARVSDHGCSCWYHLCGDVPCAFYHTIYVHSHDPDTGMFKVYDPDARCNARHNGASCRQPVPGYWSSAELDAFSRGYTDNSYLCVLLGKGAQSADCSSLPEPPAPPPASPDEGLDFACGNSMRDEGPDWTDWSYGYYKADCSLSQASSGLSMSLSSPGYTHDLLCRLEDAIVFPHASCSPRVFDHSDDRGTTVTGDWDPGYYKGECAPDEYVAAMSQSTDLKLHAIRCCKGNIAHESCATVFLDGGGGSEDPPTNDWDPDFWKGECGTGRYIAGASQQVGVPHAILCCGNVVEPDAGPADGEDGVPDGGASEDGASVPEDEASTPQESGPSDAAANPSDGVEGLQGGCECAAGRGGWGGSGALLVLWLALLSDRRRRRPGAG